MSALYQFIQIVYWLALSTWFGGVLFVAVSWHVIFRTVREADPVMPTVLSVNLEGQHGTLLAGSIVANIIGLLTRVQLVCAAALLITVAVQFRLGWQELSAAIPRAILYLAAVSLLVYDWRFVEPQIARHRKDYLDHADEPDVANAARQQFDRYHRRSVVVMQVLLAALLGMIVFSTTITAAVRTIISA